MQVRVGLFLVHMGMVVGILKVVMITSMSFVSAVTLFTISGVGLSASIYRKQHTRTHTHHASLPSEAAPFKQNTYMVSSFDA